MRQMVDKRIWQKSSLFLALIWAIACVWAPASVLAAQGGELSDDELFRLGERMYLEGILPSGEPMKAFVAGDVPVDGTSFTCVSCHLRSGLGSLEGDVSTPPTNGRILYAPREPYIPGKEFVPSFHNYAVYFPARPAYTDATLSELITTGVDPKGRKIHRVMPRYDIDSADMKILIGYLKTLSDKHSPGVSKDMIKFATVVVDGTSEKIINSLLAPLQYGVTRKNALARAANSDDRLARMGYNMMGPDLMKKKFSLKVWTLKGPSSTWRAQLEKYYQDEPVFALLSGYSAGDWAPVHKFCEDMRLPDILPAVDFPVVSEDSWYTLYFGHGVRQEGESAARYLSGMADLFKGKKVVQVVRDGNRRSAALAQGFNDTWVERGNPAVTEIVIKGDEPISAKRLQEISEQNSIAALLVWDDASAIPAIAALAKSKSRPLMVMVSGTMCKKGVWDLPEAIRSYV